MYILIFLGQLDGYLTQNSQKRWLVYIAKCKRERDSSLRPPVVFFNMMNDWNKEIK